MFLVSDIVRTPNNNQYIIVDVDDSSGEISYKCIKDTPTNRKAVVNGAIPRQRLFNADTLEYVESI